MGRSSIVEWSGKVAADSSFDIVSKVDRQEVDNALNQAAKEVRQRFDFKNTDASIRAEVEKIVKGTTSKAPPAKTTAVKTTAAVTAKK